MKLDEGAGGQIGGSSGAEGGKPGISDPETADFEGDLNPLAGVSKLLALLHEQGIPLPENNFPVPDGVEELTLQQQMEILVVHRPYVLVHAIKILVQRAVDGMRSQNKERQT